MKRRRSFLNTPNVKGRRDAIDAVLQPSSEKAIIMLCGKSSNSSKLRMASNVFTVDVVPNFALRAVKSPRNANAHGSKLMLRNPTIMSKRLHTEERLQSSVKTVRRRSLELLESAEDQSSHGSMFTMRKLLYANKTIATTNWFAGRATMARTMNTISLEELRKYQGLVILLDTTRATALGV